MSYRPLAHLSAGALDGVGTSEGGRRKLWGLGRVDVVLVTKCIASFFGEAATLASSTYTLRLAARVPGANRARTYGVLLSLFDAGGACGAALSNVRGARTACGIRRLGARTAVGDGLFGFGGGAAGVAILSLVFFGVMNYTRQARDFQGRVLDTSVAWS